MSKKSVIERGRKRQLLTNRYFSLISDLKKKIVDAETFDQKMLYNSILQKLPRDSSLSRVV